MSDQRLRQEILNLLQANPEQRHSARDVADELGLHGKASKMLPGILRQLSEAGEIAADGAGGYLLGTPCDLVQGTLVGTRSGAGFVSNRDLGCDVMVPQRDLGSALPGDTVLVRVQPLVPGADRRTGRVVRIVERAQRDIVGTLHTTGNFFVVIPLSPTYKNSFYVADPKDAKVGDRVVLRFTDWTNLHLNPEGEIIEVIGPADKPSLDTEAIVRQFELPREFPPEVLRESEQVSTRLAHPGKREDLRDRLIITIDPATARDFDDAISLELDDQGRRVLGVHIADVAHFVRTGSPLDREARKRGTSVYLVDKVIPMLPEQLSNGVCSLRPDEDRLTFSAFLTFSASGTVIARRFCRSRIRSRLRLTYEEAMAVIEGRPPETGKGVSSEIRHLIAETHRLAQQLRAARFRRAALDLAVPETQVLIDAEGRMTGVQAATHDVSHELIEECMVAANEAVATELANRHIPYISRLHEAPDPEKLGELAANLAGLGIEVGDLTHPKNLANAVTALRDNPLRHYANMLVLRSMKRAEYNAEKEGHYGLAKKFYSHFTSPIRRYPDLVLHRELAAVLGEQKDAVPTLSQLRDIAATSTETEYRAEQASRELLEIKKYRFLQQQIDDGKPLEYDAVVVKVMEFGMFVEVVDLQVSGMVHVSAMSGHFVRFNPGRQTLSSPDVSFGVGQRVRVFVASVNFNDRKVDFGLVRDGTRTLPGQRGADRAMRQGRDPATASARRGDGRPAAADKRPSVRPGKHPYGKFQRAAKGKRRK